MKKNIVYLFTLFICCSCIQSVTSSQHTTKKIVNKTEKEFFYEVYTDVGNKSIFVHPLDSSIVYFYRENPKTQILIGGTVRLNQILIFKEIIYNLTDTTAFEYDLEYSIVPEKGDDENDRIYARHLSYELGDNSTDINSKIIIKLAVTDSILKIMEKDYTMLEGFKVYYQK